jgi:SAM-dependent methyltransferase
VTDGVTLSLFGEELSRLPEDVPDSFDQAYAAFSAMPYRRPPFTARNWGHPLHSLCSYPSKMKPAIAATLVRLFTRPGEVVLDPFAGVGTVPFEACAAGRVGVAVDLSPFAYCVSAAKVAPPSPDQASELLAELAAVVASSAVPQESLGEAEIGDFFHPETWREVLVAQQFFADREPSGHLHPAHWFVKACVAHILHGNRPYALSRRSHGIIPIPPKGEAVYKPLMRSLREKVARMGLASLPRLWATGQAHLGSALHLPLEAATVDAVITSPPFLGTTDFLRQNRVRLWFCGMSYSAQREAKANTEFLENHRSFDVYRSLLGELSRVVRPGGLAVFHLGVVKKRDMAKGIAPLAAEAGFRVLGTVYEDTTELESHGRTDRGATHQHQFLFLRAGA